MKTPFICPRCGNRNPKYIGSKNGAPYCRRCISFHGETAPPPVAGEKTVRLNLAYSLSKEQKSLSDRIVFNFKAGIDTLVYAVCGSGKTEISYGVIGYAMSRGMSVRFALPRRDVVIELYERIKDAFPENKIVAVYGSHNDELSGDCVILTTHQLFRYPKYFDLLVLDEIDAFPFKGNDVLVHLFEASLRGNCVMMSATPSKEVVAHFKKPGHEILTLRTRFHKHPIPVPVSKIAIGPLKYITLIRQLRIYQKQRKQCFVFVPTVTMSESVYAIVRRFVKNGDYVSSKREGRAEIIARFKKGKLSYLITTAVLERGITVANLQVIVFGSDNRIYDEAALIQIAGRAGRKAAAPTGDVLFLANQESEGMKRAIKEIRYCNTFL